MIETEIRAKGWLTVCGRCGHSLPFGTPTAQCDACGHEAPLVRCQRCARVMSGQQTAPVYCHACYYGYTPTP